MQRGRSCSSLPELGETALEKSALGRALLQGEGALVPLGRLLGAPEAAEEVGARRVQEMKALQARLVQEPIDELESLGGPIRPLPPASPGDSCR